VTTVLNVGVDVNLSKKALAQVIEVLEKIPKLSAYSTIGIHPHEAIKYLDNKSLDQDIKELEKIYQSRPDKVVGVGECGLDFFFENSHNPSSLSEKQQKDLQIKLFKSQIDLANRLKLPLIVHCRDDRSKDHKNSEAWDMVLEMIGNLPAVLHCYSGLFGITQKILTLPNVLVSFAATITYPKNDYLRDAAKILPLEKIILETDCPFLPPQSKRGLRNEPANILDNAQLICDLKGVSLEKLGEQTSQNVIKLFALGEQKT
jgi:TatD DNase family protein